MQTGSKKWLLSLGCFAFPALTLAEEVTKASRHLASESPISFSYVMQILASFAAVIMFILFLAWFMRKSGRFGVGGAKNMRVISSLSLGMREKIVLVNVDGKNIVVGVAPGQIRTLYVPTGDSGGDQEEPEREDAGFGPVLGKFLKK